MSAGEVPAVAVEAAAHALALKAWGGWEHVPNPLRSLFLRDARTALEAAAPLMLWAAWDEGYPAGWDCEGSGAPNPYGPTP